MKNLIVPFTFGAIIITTSIALTLLQVRNWFSKFSLFANHVIVIYEPSAGRRCSRMSAFFKARATKERVSLINVRMNGRWLHASGSIFFVRKLN
jgi:hypothetical protein